jgi:hypothetical protein
MLKFPSIFNKALPSTSTFEAIIFTSEVLFIVKFPPTSKFEEY